MMRLKSLQRDWILPVERRKAFDFSLAEDGWQLQVPSLLMFLEATLLLRWPHLRMPRLALAAAIWAVYIYSLTQFRICIPLEGLGRGAQPALFGLFWSMLAAVQMIRSAQWALQDGVHKPSKSNLPDRAPPKNVKRGISVPQTPTTLAGLPVSKPSLLPEWDLMVNVRGVSRGPRLSQVCRLKAQSFWVAKLEFVASRGLRALAYLALADVADAIMKCSLVYPAAEKAEPASIWTAQHGAFGQAGPFVLALCVSVAINMLVQGCFSLMSAVYALTHPDPDIYQWTPLPVYRLGMATSLTALWGRHWHQMLRQFFQLAAQLGHWSIAPLLGKSAARAIGVLSAFAFSGLAHEWGQLYMRSPGYPSQPFGPSFLFFFGQGVLVLGEQLFHSVTGVPVAGPLGWLWTNVSLLVWGTIGPMDVSSDCGLRLLHTMIMKLTVFLILFADMV